MDSRSLSHLGRPVFLASLLTCIFAVAGCTAAASSASDPGQALVRAPLENTIEIKANGPADTVRAFYTKLREKSFREAFYLTNMRPAVEGMTDDELKEFSVEFETLARHVPAEIQITGEIISGEKATVTAKFPVSDENLELQSISLRKNGDYWVIQMVDAAAEAEMQKRGQDYLWDLKIQTNHDDASSMLERIAKAQMVHSLQNEGKYGTLAKLVEQGLVPNDVLTARSAGYIYEVVLVENGTGYYANATPVKYGRTGRNSYRLTPREKELPLVTVRDNGGKPLEK